METDNEILEKYKLEQENFINSIKRTEQALIILCKTIAALPEYNQFWLGVGHEKIRSGILALLQAASMPITDKTIEILKTRMADEDSELQKESQHNNEWQPTP